MGISGKFLKYSSSQASYLSFAEATLTQLDDPECPGVGEAFVDRLTQTSCMIVDSQPSENTQEHRDLARPAAVYTSFNYFAKKVPDGETAFRNQITVNEKADDPRHATISLTHEGLHGLQWNNAPILHASPLNGNYPDKTALIVRPRDWIKIFLLTEAESFSKQAWLSSLATHNDHDFSAAAKANPVTPERFDEIHQFEKDLKSTLIRAANDALNNWHHKKPTDVSFAQHYIDYALSLYEDSLRLKNPENVIFVTMEQSDIMKIDTIGPNIFDDPRLSCLNNLEQFLTPDLEARLKALEEKYPATMTFKQGLSEIGETEDSYLAWSKNPYGSPAAPALSA